MVPDHLDEKTVLFACFISGKMPSVNHYLKKGRHGFYKDNAQKDIEQSIFMQLKFHLSGRKFDTSKQYRIDMFFHGKFFNKNNTITRVDVDNKSKVALDVFMKATGIPDENFFTVVLKKVHSDKEGVTYQLSEA